MVPVAVVAEATIGVAEPPTQRSSAPNVDVVTGSG